MEFDIGKKEAGPIFTIIRGGHRYRESVKDVRPCDHPRFILDTKWATVTCAECKETLSAFACLLAYAEWWEQFKNRESFAEAAEKKLHVTELRRIAKLRALTDDERTEVAVVLDTHYMVDAKAIEALNIRMHRAIADRRYADRKREKALHVGQLVVRSLTGDDEGSGDDANRA